MARVALELVGAAGVVLAAGFVAAIAAVVVVIAEPAVGDAFVVVAFEFRFGAFAVSAFA